MSVLNQIAFVLRVEMANVEMAVNQKSKRGQCYISKHSLRKRNQASWSYQRDVYKQQLCPGMPLSHLKELWKEKCIHSTFGCQGVFSSSILLLDYFYFVPLVQRFKNIKACLAELKCKFPLNCGSMLELMTNITTRFVAVGEISLPEIQHALYVIELAVTMHLEY